MKLLPLHYQHLGQLSESPPWHQTMQPILRERMKVLMERLLTPPEQRKDQADVSDDYLRGRIAELRSLISFPEDRLSEREGREREAKKLQDFERRADKDAQVLATEGRFGPSTVRPPISDDPVTPNGSEGGTE